MPEKTLKIECITFVLSEYWCPSISMPPVLWLLLYGFIILTMQEKALKVECLGTVRELLSRAIFPECILVPGPTCAERL
jgi:hypothetical protein